MWVALNLVRRGITRIPLTRTPAFQLTQCTLFCAWSTWTCFVNILPEHIFKIIAYSTSWWNGALTSTYISNWHGLHKVPIILFKGVKLTEWTLSFVPFQQIVWILTVYRISNILISVFSNTALFHSIILAHSQRGHTEVHLRLQVLWPLDLVLGRYVLDITVCFIFQYILQGEIQTTLDNPHSLDELVNRTFRIEADGTSTELSALGWTRLKILLI